jgi:methyl coenzyme M reductase alpha subunit
MYISPRTDTGGPMHVAITAEGQWTDLDATSGTLAGGWHHVAVVLEPGNLKLYLDGKVVGSASTLYVLSDLGATTNNWLGRSQYSTDAYFNGALDDLRIYNYVLGDKEIADIYQSGLNSKAEGAEPK